MRSRQRGALILLGLLTVALMATVALTPSRRPAVALAATNACRSNATGTYSDIVVGLSGTATPSAATVGVDTITLSGFSFQADVPATLLVSGYNLGLLTVGANSIPVKGWVGIAGANTTEGVQVVQFTATVDTTITDTDGIPGNGDESATPLVLNLGLGDTTWTPTGGNVAFSQAAPGALPAIPAGQVSPGATTPAGGVYISAQVANGLIKANFDCQGGTSAVGGASFSASAPGAFATVAVTGGVAPSTAASTVPPTSLPASTAPSTTSSTTTSSATAASASAVPSTGPISGSATYSTSCKNSVTPDLSTLEYTATGTVPGQVNADSSFTLSNMKWKVTIPASVFQTGINLGLVTPGTPISGTIDLAVTATNTVQATQDSAKIPLTVPVAAGADSLALPSTVEFDVADMTWTSRTGKMDFSLYGANVTVGLTPTLQVVFVCKPSSTAAFVSSNAVGVSAATTTVRVASAAPVQSAPSLVSTGPSGSIVVQILVALVLLDLGHLTLSLRRSPRHAARRR